MTENPGFHAHEPRYAVPWVVPSPPKPGVVPLRPLGIGEILDGAVSYIRANPRVTLGLSAVVALIGQLLILATRLFDHPEQTAPLIPELGELQRYLDITAGGTVTQIASVLVGLVVTVVLTGLLMPVVAGAVLGRRSRLHEVWGLAGSRLLGLFAVCSLTFVSSVVAFFLVLIPIGVVSMSLAMIDTQLWIMIAVWVAGYLAAACLAVYLWVLWSLAPAVYVLEGGSVLGALGRSRRLVRGKFWRVLGIQLLGKIIAGVVGGILSGILLGASIALLGASGGSGVEVLVPAILAIGAIVSSAITTPFVSGVLGLLYIDQRMRRDGLDIQLAHTAAIEGVSLRDAFGVWQPSAPEPSSIGTELPRAS